ncbi:hypothetical protein H6775_02020 [Candidatus Nomurabacteria bacterium]|nr:hypothetical protein [Candidatus Nomurabacteria bacterium]
MGAITLADGIGRNITQMFGLDCRTSFAEKRFDEKEGEIMAFDTTPVFPREMLILCEDVTTTGGSVIKTVRAGKKEGAKIARFILALVNRSDATEIEGYKVISLLKKRDLPVMPKWSPADGCPLCEAGSKILRGSPKSRDNWAQLTGQA